MSDSISTVFVVGAGFMGSGIAQSTIQAGYHTWLWAPDVDELQQSLTLIESNVQKMIEKGRLKEKPAEIIGRLRGTICMEDASGTDLVIETVVENLEIKKEVFRKLNLIVSPHAVMASNTSTIPITRLASFLGRPENMVGLHFTSPVPLMPVAEVIRTIVTSEQTFQKAIFFIRSLGKEPIPVYVDQAGFVFNRINLPSNVEAIRLVERGVASIDDIDKAMRLGFGRPMGPFETADMVGLDTGYYALLSLYEETRDTKFLPPDLLCQKVLLGHLGKKVGKGWYEYDAKGNKIGVVQI